MSKAETQESGLPDELSGYRSRPPAAVVMPLAVLGAMLIFGVPLARTVTGIDHPPQHAQNTTRLIASPNNPQMLQAIRYAQKHAQGKAGGNGWSKPAADGQSVTFEALGGPITLSRAEIAEANELYPFLVHRAKDPDTFRSAGRSANDDFDSGPNDSGGWGTGRME